MLATPTGGKPAPAGEQATAGDPNVSKKIYFKGTTATKMQLQQKRCKQGLKQQKGRQQMKGCLQHQKLQQQFLFFKLR
jgi:hypothetical protein